ncbi:hypothetical protein [Micromonospora sp. DT227]|uniref:hypothetical protein n=1 Tax=Micromonospora sp. DT227 TaxID=3393433 RepID=UPI003CE9CCE1
MDTVMSKNPKASRLAATYRLRYAEALAVIREDSGLAHAMATKRGISLAEAERQIHKQYAEARERADRDEVSFRTALAEVRSELEISHEVDELTNTTPSMEELLREMLPQTCDGLVGEQIEVPGEDNYHVPGLDFAEVELPRNVDEISLSAVDLDLDTLVWTPAERYEDGTQVGTAEVNAHVTLDGFMAKYDTYGDHDVEIWTFDWNDHMSYVGFGRDVVLEFQVTAPVTGAIDNLALVGARETRRLLGPHHLST